MTQQNQIAVIDRAKALMPDAKKYNAANPFEMSFAQEAGFAMMAIQNNPYLLNCTPDSIRSAVISTALTGITLNPSLKYAYLVPRKSKNELKCILDISYIGMIKILTDAGAVKNVFADVVCENDHFVYGQGSQPILEHKPNLLKDRGAMIGAYAIAYFRDGGFQFEVMARPEIEKVRATSESWKSEATRQYSPWETWTDEMWKKTVLKRLFKVLPKTKFNDQLIAALSKDHENEIADVDQKNERLSAIFEDVDEVHEDASETIFKTPDPEPEVIEAKQTKIPDEVFNEVQKGEKK